MKNYNIVRRTIAIIVWISIYFIGYWIYNISLTLPSYPQGTSPEIFNFLMEKMLWVCIIIIPLSIAGIVSEYIQEMEDNKNYKILLERNSVQNKKVPNYKTFLDFITEIRPSIKLLKGGVKNNCNLILKEINTI